MPLVLVRTPTYRRPELLKRAIRCLQDQTHQDWICEVRDDCPDASARPVVEEIGDPRVRYTRNRPQKFMVRNLDDCFLQDNPYRADYFFMLEDDNQVLPQFMAHGCEILGQTGLNICQINQAVEFAAGTKDAWISDFGIFDDLYVERVHQPEEIHLAILGAIGISNGAVFWSRNIRKELAIRVDTIPTLEEYLRTVLVREPVYISRQKLAVWAESEQTTHRNLGANRNWLKRELKLKASITGLQRMVWDRTPASMQKTFLDGGILRIPVDARYRALQKAGIRFPGVGERLSAKAFIKRAVVRYVGRVHPSVIALVAE